MYACIADVLGMMAAGGIKDGPTASISFKKAFASLEVCAMIYSIILLRVLWNDLVHIVNLMECSMITNRIDPNIMYL